MVLYTSCQLMELPANIVTPTVSVAISVVNSIPLTVHERLSPSVQKQNSRASTTWRYLSAMKVQI